jgi:hypothetical protein
MVNSHRLQFHHVVDVGIMYPGLIMEKVMIFGEPIPSGNEVTRYFKSGNLYKKNVQGKVITTINA